MQFNRTGKDFAFERVQNWENSRSTGSLMVKSIRMRWAGHVVRMGKGRVVYRVLFGKPEGKRPLGRPRRR
jgi:hypothetical protein